MKREELLELLGEIDQRHIAAALDAPRPRRRLKAPLALCACLCLLLGAALWLSGGRLPMPAAQPDGPAVQSPNAPTPDMPRVRAADLLAPADGQVAEQALRYSLLPVAGRMAEYHEAAVSESGKALLPDSLGEAFTDVPGWHLLRGHSELQYLVHKEPDGSFTLWEFAYFTVLDDQEQAQLAQSLADGQSTWAELPWFSLELDFSPYPYSLALERIYGISSASDLLRVTVSPANMDNTDAGRALQAEIGTLEITDAQALARLYDALCAMTCLGSGNWELINVSGDGELLDAVRQTRYLTVETPNGVLSSLKYTACSDRFYEYSGVAYSVQGADTAAELCQLFGIR